MLRVYLGRKRVDAERNQVDLARLHLVYGALHQPLEQIGEVERRAQHLLEVVGLRRLRFANVLPQIQHHNLGQVEQLHLHDCVLVVDEVAQDNQDVLEGVLQDPEDDFALLGVVQEDFEELAAAGVNLDVFRRKLAVDALHRLALDEPQAQDEQNLQIRRAGYVQLRRKRRLFEFFLQLAAYLNARYLGDEYVLDRQHNRFDLLEDVQNHSSILGFGVYLLPVVGVLNFSLNMGLNKHLKERVQDSK